MTELLYIRGAKQSSEQRMWQQVVLVALTDATRPALPPGLRSGTDPQAEADQWLRDGGKEFRLVCDLAGLDPDFVRHRYLAGDMDPVAIRSAHKQSKGRPRHGGTNA